MESFIRAIYRPSICQTVVWILFAGYITVLDCIGWQSASDTDFNRPDTLGIFGFLAWLFVSLPLFIVKLVILYVLTLGGRINLLHPLQSLPPAFDGDGQWDWLFLAGFDVLFFAVLFGVWRLLVFGFTIAMQATRQRRQLQ